MEQLESAFCSFWVFFIAIAKFVADKKPCLKRFKIAWNIVKLERERVKQFFFSVAHVREPYLFTYMQRRQQEHRQQCWSHRNRNTISSYIYIKKTTNCLCFIIIINNVLCINFYCIFFGFLCVLLMLQMFVFVNFFLRRLWTGESDGSQIWAKAKNALLFWRIWIRTRA